MNQFYGIIRDLPDSYQIYDKLTKPMSLSLARAQHQKYKEALLGVGVSLTTIDADERWYDCVFVEDTAVVWDSCVLITRMQNDRCRLIFWVLKIFSLFLLG